MKNSNDKILLTSSLTIVICSVLMAGSTFAWFTDSKQVGVADIKIAAQTEQQTSRSASSAVAEAAGIAVESQATLVDAINNAKAKETTVIYLEKDIQLEPGKVVVDEDKKITLDLREYDINSEATEEGGVLIENNGTLNLTGAGNIAMDTAAYSADSEAELFIVKNSGKLNITGANLSLTSAESDDAKLTESQASTKSETSEGDSANSADTKAEEEGQLSSSMKMTAKAKESNPSDVKETDSEEADAKDTDTKDLDTNAADADTKDLDAKASDTEKAETSVINNNVAAIYSVAKDENKAEVNVISYESDKKTVVDGGDYSGIILDSKTFAEQDNKTESEEIEYFGMLNILDAVIEGGQHGQAVLLKNSADAENTAILMMDKGNLIGNDAPALCIRNDYEGDKENFKIVISEESKLEVKNSADNVDIPLINKEIKESVTTIIDAPNYEE